MVYKMSYMYHSKPTNYHKNLTLSIKLMSFYVQEKCNTKTKFDFEIICTVTLS